MENWLLNTAAGVKFSVTLSSKQIIDMPVHIAYLYKNGNSVNSSKYGILAMCPPLPMCNVVGITPLIATPGYSSAAVSGFYEESTTVGPDCSPAGGNYIVTIITPVDKDLGQTTTATCLVDGSWQDQDTTTVGEYCCATGFCCLFDHSPSTQSKKNDKI